MRATTRFLLLGALAMCLSACLPEPPMGNEAAIFKRPSRYGWGASGRRPGPGVQPEQKKQEQRSSNNRFGHTENKREPSNSGSNSSQGGSNSDTGSDSGSNSLDPPSPIVAADDDDKKKMTDSGSSDSGSSSGDSSPGGSSKSSSSTPPSNLNDYPYARLVPGKKGAVTLPGVGEIDVTGIKPGTPVEIDDPNNPGKKIYFRVP